jgi:hypothetical protein
MTLKNNTTHQNKANSRRKKRKKIRMMGLGEWLSRMVRVSTELMWVAR